MKANYDFRAMKEKTHPLQTKIDSGELKLVDYFNITEEEFEEKLQHLDDDERKFALQYRQNKLYFFHE